MELKRKILLLVFFLNGGGPAISQAVFINLYTFNDYTIKTHSGHSASLGADSYSGIGYEKVINNKFSIAVSFNASHNAIFSIPHQKSTYVTPGKYGTPITPFSVRENYFYVSHIKYIEPHGQVKYLFREQSMGGFYLSGGMGFCYNRWTFRGYPYINTSIDYSKAIKTREKFVTIPVSLTFGNRGVIEGFYNELFIGVVYNQSLNKIPQNEFLNEFFGYDPISKVSFTCGYIFGLGWYD